MHLDGAASAREVPAGNLMFPLIKPSHLFMGGHRFIPPI